MKAASLVTRLSNSTAYKVCGLISPTHEDNGKYLCEKPIYYFDTYKDFSDFATSRAISAVLFAHERDARKEADELVSFCYKNSIKVLVAPPSTKLRKEWRCRARSSSSPEPPAPTAASSRASARRSRREAL